MSTSRISSLGSVGLLFLASVSLVQAGTIQGQVKGPDGKPASGAEVRIEQADSKTVMKSAKTDKQGRYVFQDLGNAKYKVTALVNNVPTTAKNVSARSIGATRVDFDIKPTAAAAAKATNGKKAKRFVWVPSETGSHLGGRWVEVDEDGRSTASGLPVETVSGDDLKRSARSSFGSQSGHAGTGGH